MKLEEIEVRRLPGITEPYRVAGLSPHVNLIVGPNGIGKSSLCRAVNATLWPDASARPDDEVTSVWLRRDARLTAQLAGTVRWTGVTGSDRSGAAPALPDGALRRCVTLGMRDLLDDDSGEDRELADRLRVQMAGGFDLHEVAERFRTRRGHGKREAKELSDARRALRELQGRRRELALEADSLSEIEAQRLDARRAEATLVQLRRAAELRGLQDQQSEAKRELARFPDAMEVLRGDELGRLKDLDRELESVAVDREDAIRRLEAAELDLAACRLAGGPVADAELNAALDRARELARLEQEEPGLEQRLGAALEACRAAGLQLGVAALQVDGAAACGEPLTAELALTSQQVDEVERWLLDAMRSQERRSLLEAQLAALSEAISDDDLLDERRASQLRRGLAMLGRWLELEALPAKASRWLRPLAAGVLMGGLGGLLGRVLAASGGPVAAWMAPLLEPVVGTVAVPAAVAFCGAVLLGMLGFLLAAPPRWSKLRRRIEQAFAALAAEEGLPAPAAWGRVDVEVQCSELEGRLRRRDEARSRQREVEGLRRRVEHEDDLARPIAARRSELAAQLGLDPAADAYAGSLAIADRLDRLKRYREQRLALAECEGSHRALCARRDERRAVLAHSLARLQGDEPGSPSAVDAARAMAVLDDLKDRSARWCRTDSELESARRDIARGDQRREDALRRQLEVLREASVVAGEPTRSRRELEDRLGELEAFRSARSRLAELDAKVATLEGQLSEAPELARLSSEEILERSEAAERLASQRELFSNRIALIEDRVRAAQEGDGLEAAMAAEHEAETVLAQRREERLLAAAGEFLVRDVEGEYEEQSRPEVLERAAELFAAFTERRYTLRLESGAGETGEEGGARRATFYAVEAETGRQRALCELSDGTRMQLLLAARLAFALHAEGGEPLPLFLDEALTASDPARFRAVVESLLWLAQHGRQVFYLTCNPADVDYWRAIARDRGFDEPNAIDLAEIRGLAPMAASGTAPDGSRFEAPSLPRVPSPEGVDAGEYGALLGVERPRLHAPAGALHWFHLLRDDLPLLHRLLDGARLQFVGSWRLLDCSAWGAVGLTPEEGARVEAWAEFADAFFEGLAVGRGRPLDRSVLYRSGAVSPTYLDRLSELADELDGDARRFVEMLDRRDDERTKGFQKAKRDQLVEYLRAHSHLTDDVPHPLETLRVHCLARVASAIEAGSLSTREVAARVDELHALVLGGPTGDASA